MFNTVYIICICIGKLFSSGFSIKFSHEYFHVFQSLSEKNSVRTDRNLEFFSDANMHNVYMLERVLKTFLILRPEMGEYKR